MTNPKVIKETERAVERAYDKSEQSIKVHEKSLSAIEASHKLILQLYELHVGARGTFK